MIKNPVLKGFHADPSMICVDGTFYVANSTFDYYPGVKISASRDLANWHTVSYPLKDKKHVNLKGNPTSAGVWAPCLSYCDGVFYLVYSDIKFWANYPFKECYNYIITATDTAGEWSDPVYTDSRGFDASLFPDDDGRKYYMSMEWDYRKKDGGDQFTGILLTEVDAKTLKPIAETKKIFTGTDRKLVEGPHIFKKNGYYYLFTAEGGTTLDHAETVARSKNIYGPYELHPFKHMATTAFAKKTSYLQKVGHGSLCEGPDHRWWFAFLCGRPYGKLKTCPLGRETGISEVVWKEDWPYLLSGTQVPDAEFNGYGELQEIKEKDYDFTSAEFRGDFQSLRVPAKYEIVGKTLRLYGNEVPSSAHEQSLLARRQDSADFEAETVVDFAPTCYRQLAGLTYRYNEDNQYYLRISWDENKNERVVGVLAWDKGRFSRTPDEKEISVGKSGKVWLKVSVKGEDAVFSCSTDGVNYKTLPGVYCATKLSDEYATPMGFMGAFVGMMATDFERKTSYADFLSFKYTRK